VTRTSAVRAAPRRPAPPAPTQASRPPVAPAAAPATRHDFGNVRVLARETKREPEAPSPPPPAAAPVTAGPAPIRTVKVWINAFIPVTIPGKTIPAVGPHAGKTMLNGPPGSGCYLGDNRGFSAAIHAPSRMHAEIEIDVAGPSETFRWTNCDTTHEIDCTTGAALCTRSGRTSDMTFTGLRGTAASLIEFDMTGASNNPCYTGSPDIDYEGKVGIDVRGRRVTFAGKIDDFPAFEMYATANGGGGTPLFTTMPLAGKDPFNLFGKAARAQTGSAVV
jgi:hypothetical protein